MTTHYLLKVDQQALPHALMVFDDQTRQCQVMDQLSWDDERLAVDDIKLLIPVTWSYHSTTHVASKNLEILAKSIPYAIEEELSNEVEDNFFAFRLNSDGSQDVVATNQNQMQRLQQTIEDKRLSVAAIYCETEWLLTAEDTVCIWFDEDSALIKLDAQQAMRVAKHQVADMLPVFAADKSLLRANQNIDVNAGQWQLGPPLTAAQCCEHLLSSAPLNLYTEELRSSQQPQTQESWRLVIGLVAAVLVSWILIQAIQWYQLDQDIDELKGQQQALFQQVYPDSVPAELADPYAALQSRLKLSSEQNRAGSQLFLTLVDHLGQATSQHPLVQLRSLRLVDDKTEVQVVGPRLTVINEFHQTLQQQAPAFNVQIGVNELNDDNTYNSILTLVPR